MNRDRLIAALVAGAVAGGAGIKLAVSKGYEKGYEAGYREGNQWGQQEGRRRTLRELEAKERRRDPSIQRAEDAEKRVKELLAVVAEVAPDHPVLKS
jgi:flagellar biosynthesis/type III secretory pathway protein FliH